MNVTDTYILFELAGAAYGVRSANVQHVEMLEHVTRVPHTAAAVDGVVFSRGQVFPALNLRVRFGLPRESYTPRTRLIFLKVESRVVALIVDAAREFVRIPTEGIKPIEDTLVGLQGNYIEGVASVKGRSILILDVGAVLTLEETTLPPALDATASPARLS
jgi:purine-binding chemotaxis protein CheW